MASWALHATFSFRPLSPATPYISHFFGLLERSVGWQIPLVHKSPPHFCFDSGSTCAFEAADLSCIPRKMRDLLCLLFSVLGFSGLGFWFRARLFLGAERFVDLSTSVLRLEKFAQKCFCFAAAILRAFFLRALVACMLLHGCCSVCISASLDQALQRDASRFRFPARPTLCTCFRLHSGTCLKFDTANLEFALHSHVCHFCRSALALLFHQPVVWAAALLLLFACSAAPMVQCSSCQRLQHDNPSFWVLRTFCMTVVVARRGSAEPVVSFRSLQAALLSQ